MKIIVPNDSNGKALFNFLKNNGIPFSVIQKCFRKGNIKINGIITDQNKKLSTDDEIFIPWTKEDKPLSTPYKKNNIKFDILYEDKNFLAINKPNGLAVQGGTNIKESVDNYAKTNNLKLVHRLDKDTSGALLLAKTIETARKFADAFKNKLISKTYHAITCGMPEDYFGVINMPIKKSLISGEEKMVADDAGDEAITKYKIIKPLSDNLFLLELSPITGRKHQLRVHCAYMNSPILGDNKYSGDKSLRNTKMFLHAYKIIINKQVLGKEITIHAPIPEHFKKLINK